MACETCYQEVVEGGVMPMSANEPNVRTVPVLYKSESDCCGCGACMSVCPKDAVTMQPNRYGFLYPHIDKDACIGCYMCLKVCAFKHD